MGPAVRSQEPALGLKEGNEHTEKACGGVSVQEPVNGRRE